MFSEIEVQTKSYWYLQLSSDWYKDTSGLLCLVSRALKFKPVAAHPVSVPVDLSSPAAVVSASLPSSGDLLSVWRGRLSWLVIPGLPPLPIMQNKSHCDAS